MYAYYLTFTIKICTWIYKGKNEGFLLTFLGLFRVLWVLQSTIESITSLSIGTFHSFVPPETIFLECVRI
jgi:hypothetical protein